MRWGCAPRLMGFLTFILILSVSPCLGDDDEPKKSWVADYLANTLGPAPEESDSIFGALKATRPSGHFRIYNFSRQNTDHKGTNWRSLAVGGETRVTTGSYKGVSMAFWMYDIRAIGVYDPAIAMQQLVGPSHNLNTLAVANVRYKNDHVLFVGGRQLIDTPYARHDFYTMLPRSMNGVSLTIRPLPWDKIRPADYFDPEGESVTFPTAKFDKPSLHIFASRMFQYESRFRDHFNMGNRYTDGSIPGFVTFGADYFHPIGKHMLYARNYYYDFYSYALLGYWEAGYRYEVTPNLKPFLQFQYISQTDNGYSTFGRVNADVYGLQAGVLFYDGYFKFVWGMSPTNYNSFRHGGMVHPYNDISYTQYADTMNDAISDTGPGTAFGARVGYKFFNKSLELSVSFVRYRVTYGFDGAAYNTAGPFGFPNTRPLVPNQIQWGFDPTILYKFSGKLKGLSVGNDVGLRVSANEPHGPLLENRFRLIYEF